MEHPPCPAGWEVQRLLMVFAYKQKMQIQSWRALGRGKRIEFLQLL